MAAIFAALFALPANAPAPRPPAPVIAYTYDAPVPTASIDPHVERDPPSTYTDATIYDADGLWSLGPLARQYAEATRTTYD